MPRFYFHLHNDFDVPDLEGLVLPNLEAAVAHAASEARTLAGELVKEKGRIVLGHRIDIEDEHETLLSTVQFRDVVQVEP